MPLHEGDRSRISPEWLREPERERQRFEQLRQEARERGCSEAVEVMLQAVNAMDGFIRPSNLYAPPTPENFSTEEKWLKSGAARDAAWYKVEAIHAQFDRQDAVGASDWLRALGTVRAAMQPGEGIPGLCTVLAPKQGEEPTPDWEKFQHWAENKYLNPKGLAMIAERLRATLNITSPATAEKLVGTIDTTSTRQLDHVLMSALGMDQLYINMGGYYHQLDEVLVELDPQRLEAAHERGKAAITATEFSAVYHRARVDLGHRVAAAWDEEQAHGVKRRGSEALQRLRMAAYDAAYQGEYVNPVAVEIARSSAAARREPLACLVGRMSAAQARTDHSSSYKLAAGVHAISPEIIKLIVGEERLLTRTYALTMRGGAVVRPESTNLLSSTGPQLDQRDVPVTDVTAIPIYVEALVKTHPDLPFVRPNEEFIKDGVDQIIIRAGNTLQRRDNFNLAVWYGEQLKTVWPIRNIAELADHADTFTLMPVDVLTVTNGEERSVAEMMTQIERDFPATITVQGRSYEVYYHDSDHVIVGYVDINPFAQAEFLQWHETDLPRPGLHFTVTTRLRRESYPTLAEAQDALDWHDLDVAWSKYPQRDFNAPVAVALDQPFPDVATVVTEQFPTGILPYATAKNGEPRYPVPTITAEWKDSYELHLVKNSADAERLLKTARQRYQAAIDREQRLAAIDPDRRAAFEARITAFDHRLATAKVQRTPYYDACIGSVIQAKREANERLVNGEIDIAERALTSAETTFTERIATPSAVWEQLQTIWQGLYFKPTNLADFDITSGHLDAHNYGRDGHIKRLPTLEQLERLLRALQPMYAEQQRQRAEQERAIAERQTREIKWTEMTSEQRLQERDKGLRVLRPLYNELSGRLSREPRRGLRPARIEFIRSVLAETRPVYSHTIRRVNEVGLELRQATTISVEQLEDLVRWIDTVRGDLERLNTVGHFRGVEGELE